MIIERASIAAVAFVCLSAVNTSDDNATDGAAPNNPANVFGLKRSESSEKSETMEPPIMNLRVRSFKFIDLLNAHLCRFCSLNRFV